MWREVLRINEATVEGLSQSQLPPTHEQEFYKELRHSNEVFAAFKVHKMGSLMALKLTDEDGKLKSYRQWKEDIKGISNHFLNAWLKTEYNTAVIRAHNAADWRQFERNKDIMPNLRWMPTVSPNPEAEHRVFWERKLTRPIDDPFWNKHRPGNRWNCKCSLEATDDPITPLPTEAEIRGDQPQRGLENNPGKDGQLFSKKHPYFPNNCKECGFNNKKKTITNWLRGLFNARKMNCGGCKGLKQALNDAKTKGDVAEMFAKLQELAGANYVEQLRNITEAKIYEMINKNIMSAVGKEDKDYKNLMAGAKKAAMHGYNVFILPNPKGVRSADYIFVRNDIYKMYDLKTISGKSSIGTRLAESIGQTNRVFLNLATNYPTNRMAVEIKKYFESNGEALEVLIAKGKKFVSVERDFAMDRHYHKQFRKMIEQ